MQHNATASAEPGKSGLEFLFVASVVVVPVIDTVSVVEAGAPAAATVGWEKMHDAPAGNPVQVNETAELNPFTGTIDIAAVPGCAELIVSDDGEDETEKSPETRLMV
jgi:hypothetical protein